jgi:hypothetical protein
MFEGGMLTQIDKCKSRGGSGVGRLSERWAEKFETAYEFSNKKMTHLVISMLYTFGHFYKLA